MTREFPVHSEDRRHTPQPHSVPWGWLQQFEARALGNHGQSLEKLASRGGMGWDEMLAIACDMSLGAARRAGIFGRDAISPVEAQKKVLALVAGWEAQGK